MQEQLQGAKAESRQQQSGGKQALPSKVLVGVLGSAGGQRHLRHGRCLLAVIVGVVTEITFGSQMGVTVYLNVSCATFSSTENEDSKWPRKGIFRHTFTMNDDNSQSSRLLREEEQVA